MMGVGKPKLFTKLQVASCSRCRNKGTRIFWEAPAPVTCGNVHFSSGCDFTMGRVKLMLLTKYEAANPIPYGNIGEIMSHYD